MNKFIFGECDCCAKPNRVLHHISVDIIGAEGYGCAECFHNQLSDDIDDLECEILRITQTATIPNFAHLANLQSALAEARQIAGVAA